MEYISEEQYFEQPQEVRKVIMDWFINKDCQHNFVLSISQTTSYKVVYIPELSETMLRKFIEEKIGGKIGVDFGPDGYVINVSKYVHDGYYCTLKSFYTEYDDLLQAYWQVACEISKELSKCQSNMTCSET